MTTNQIHALIDIPEQIRYVSVATVNASGLATPPTTDADADTLTTSGDAHTVDAHADADMPDTTGAAEILDAAADAALCEQEGEP